MIIEGVDDGGEKFKAPRLGEGRNIVIMIRGGVA